MNGKKIIYYLIALSLIMLQFSCSNTQGSKQTEVHRNVLDDVRLGDGIPLNLNITLRWAVTEGNIFYRQFPSTDSFNQKILIPRSLELVKKTSNKFESVDSVFSTQRDLFIDEIKSTLITGLVEDGITIKDVIVSDIIFPQKFILAKETVGLKDQEIERIRQQKIVNIEKAKALKEQASADGQVERMKAKAEADKNRSLAEAEVEKVRDLKNIEVQKKREMEQIAVDKVSQLDKVEFEKQIQLARLCQENPTYASFLVNKELASKVGIAVLPTGSEQNVFDNIINHNMPGSIK